MSTERKIICIVCPVGCNMTATIDDEGNVLKVIDNQCKEGKKHATSECKFPGRVLTTTVLTEGSLHKLLPVRSDRPIRKDRLMECAHLLARVKVRPNVSIGQVIVPNIAGTGVDIVSTDELVA
jgi:CxxC motif-containing protein